MTLTLTQLRNLRLAGERPADMVLLSLVGRIDRDNPVVLLESEREPDWRSLADLDVQIAHAGQAARVVGMCDEILKTVPLKSLSTWNVVTDQTVLVEQNGIRILREVP